MNRQRHYLGYVCGPNATVHWIHRRCLRGQRTELDYSKYANFLRPNEKWTEPLLMFTGLAVDDFSGVIKSLTTTVAPSARDCVRLYRRSVLPKSMWLPERSMHLARNWDAFGTERIVAIDNGLDLVSDMALYMFLDCGAIPLRMPPNRGDYKGSIERTIKSFETMFVSSLNGFVNAKFVGFDKRYRRIRERARAQADETVRSYEEKAAKFCNDYNHMPTQNLRSHGLKSTETARNSRPFGFPAASCTYVRPLLSRMRRLSGARACRSPPGGSIVMNSRSIGGHIRAK